MKAMEICCKRVLREIFDKRARARRVGRNGMAGSKGKMTILRHIVTITPNRKKFVSESGGSAISVKL